MLMLARRATNFTKVFRRASISALNSQDLAIISNMRVVVPKSRGGEDEDEEDHSLWAGMDGAQLLAYLILMAPFFLLHSNAVILITIV